jgi:pimeloyl-ACP methyl ester carboxylesterase
VKIIDKGAGAPVVLVPGIQGRWEWMHATVDALATRCRVITFSLADEPSSGASFDAASGFSSYVHQIEAALDARGIPRATICGVSYGGLIAAAFAAQKPDRVSGLVLSSALPPSWRPDRRVRFFLRAPRLLAPLFCLNAVRLFPEIAAARGGLLPGLRFGLRAVVTVFTHMFSPWRMARRVRLVDGLELEAGLRGLSAPALIITGEPARDWVVPVGRTLEYLRLLPHATSATIARTGHLGLVTRPGTFADLVARHARAAALPERRRVV